MIVLPNEPGGTVFSSFIFTSRPRRLLYLDVDVVFALGDDLDVGTVDGLLVVLYARRPVC